MSYLPLVSIVIPSRNEEKFIGMCLDSIIANDYPKDKIEVLIVDGVSEDGTREIVEKYIQQYPFIKISDNLTTRLIIMSVSTCSHFLHLLVIF